MITLHAIGMSLHAEAFTRSYTCLIKRISIKEFKIGCVYIYIQSVLSDASCVTATLIFLTRYSHTLNQVGTWTDWRIF